jgi:hypothetical protein
MLRYLGFRDGIVPAQLPTNFRMNPVPEPMDWPTLLLNYLDPEAFESIENHSPISRPVCFTCPSHPLAVADDDENQPCLYTLVIDNRTSSQRIGVDDLRWNWSGSWRQQNGLFWADAPGDKATLRFEGIGIDVIGPTSDSGGRADVYVDGIRQEWPLDAFSPDPKAGGETLWSSVDFGGPDTPDSKHTLEIVATGMGDPRSTQIGIMGVIVYQRRERDARRVRWTFRDREEGLTLKSMESSSPAATFGAAESSLHASRRLLWQVGPRMSFPQANWQLRNQPGPHANGMFQQSFGSEKLKKQLQAAMESSTEAESDAPISSGMRRSTATRPPTFRLAEKTPSNPRNDPCRSGPPRFDP